MTTDKIPLFLASQGAVTGKGDRDRFLRRRASGAYEQDAAEQQGSQSVAVTDHGLTPLPGIQSGGTMYIC